MVPTRAREHTEREIYVGIRAAIHRGEYRTALRWVGELADQGEELWRYLRELATTEVSYHDRQTAVLVRTLYENVKLDPDNNIVFLSQAVNAISLAPKGTAGSDY
jgi:hypothetical protein